MDGYPILNLTNFRIRIGYGYAKNFSDVDQELKNQYPLTSARDTVLMTRFEHNAEFVTQAATSW